MSGEGVRATTVVFAALLPVGRFWIIGAMVLRGISVDDLQAGSRPERSVSMLHPRRWRTAFARRDENNCKNTQSEIPQGSVRNQTRASAFSLLGATLGSATDAVQSNRC